MSLVVRGEVAERLREAGIITVTDLAERDPRGELPVPGVPVADTVALARAWRRELPVVRRVPRVPVRRADVEVDIDMESFGESGAYLWGALLTYLGGLQEGDQPAGYHAFATWDPLPTLDEARSFAEFWAWLSGVRARAAASGRSFAAYCYNAHAENRWLLGSAQRFAGRPGFPRWPRWRSSWGIRRGSTSTPSSTSGSSARRAKASNASRPRPGSAWRDTEAGGENSMRWYRAAVGLDGAPADPVQRKRLLEYNADDVAATHALREWMTSPRIEDVPLAADL